jgi:hypothetical protein
MDVQILPSGSTTTLAPTAHTNKALWKTIQFV